MHYDTLRLLLTASLLSFFSGFGFSQTVTFSVIPANSFVRVNGEVLDLSKQRTLELPAGTYEAEFWAPQFSVVTETITVNASGTNTVRLGLKKLSPKFEDYREARSVYNTQILKRTLTDFTLVGGTLAAGYTTLALKNNSLTADENKLDVVEQDIARSLNRYQTVVAPVELDLASAEYNRLVDRYEELQEKRNTGIAAGATITVIGAGLTFLYFRKWRSKPEKPLWKADNPFTSTDSPVFMPAIGFNGQGGQAGFTLTF